MKLLPISIERIMTHSKPKCYLDDSLIICNFDELPLPNEYRHMQCALVVLCVRGQGQYTVGTISNTVKPNDVIIVGQGQVLGDIRFDDDFEAEIMFISPDFLQDAIRETNDVTNLFLFSRQNPVVSMSTEEVMMFKEYIAFLKMKMSDTTHTYRRQVAGCILGSMIYELCNAIKRYSIQASRHSNKSQAVFEKFIKLVEANFRTERRVGWYSEQLDMSPKTLLETVKRVSKRTPNEWLDVYTTLEIRLLLRHTSKPIKEIAEELNFGSQSSLGKFFREHVGISPSAYRQS